MSWIGILILILHVGVCIGLILIVLLQAGKGASLGAAFGGGASQTVFGARSATLIGRLTWVLFTIFMITSLLLTLSPWRHPGTVRSDILQEESVPPPSESTPQPGAPEGTFSGEVTQPAESPETPGQATPVQAPAQGMPEQAAPKQAAPAQTQSGAKTPAPASQSHK